MDEPIPMQRRARGPAAVAWALVFAAIVLGALFAMDRPQAEDTTTRGVREVVQLQLLAFQADDAGMAFQLADPGIRSKFSNADEFLRMVRAQYPMVHRPASIVFLKPQGDGHMAFQKVRLTDTAGSAWLVTYLLNRQKDDRWLISACLVVPDTPRVTA